MGWSIAEVARMSGVTSRTLRYYDQVGLLTPGYTGANGYRYYNAEQLLRLQQILLLRELGVGLGDIAEAIGSQPDRLAALRRHHLRLLAERDRLGRLADTVARTIAELEEGDPLSQPQIRRPENLFEGFSPAAYEAEVLERWPAEFEQASEAAAALTAAQVASAQQQMTAHMVRMAELMAAGKPAGDAEVRAEVSNHYRWVSQFWTPGAEAYAGLGRMYVEDERFRIHYDQIAAGLAAYQRDAMAAFAQAELR